MNLNLHIIIVAGCAVFGFDASQDTNVLNETTAPRILQRKWSGTAYGDGRITEDSPGGPLYLHAPEDGYAIYIQFFHFGGEYFLIALLCSQHGLHTGRWLSFTGI